MFHQQLKVCEIKENLPESKSFAPSSHSMSHEVIQKRISELESKNQAIPLRLRFDVFKTLLELNQQSPENIPSPIVRSFFDYDLAFTIRNVRSWSKKKELADQALKNIAEFFDGIELPKEMSFFQHSYYCFCLSGLITGIEPKDLAKEYDKSLKTMVYGVVHPVGKWSIKSELENQNFSKYISHVSKTGFATIDEINQMTTFRLNKESSFSGVRILAIACNEDVEFDGVKKMEVDGVKRDVRSLEVLKHDFIHAGFLRRHFEKNPIDFRERFNKLGMIYEQISEDKKLENNPELRQLVKAAWFFWLHEFTTSIYVDGIPEKLPKKHLRAHGKYANEPQIVLKGAAKLHYLPDLFVNEIDVELKIFQHLKIPLASLESKHNQSKSAIVTEMINKLHFGYEYLDQYFSKDFDIKKSKHWLLALVKRELQARKTIAPSEQKPMFGT